jgi:small GTP-binding protein
LFYAELLQKVILSIRESEKVVDSPKNRRMELRRPNCKIVLLGNSGVGKTSIVMRWASGTYQVDVHSTVGANHQRKTISLGDSDLDIYVWDTAGQEQFQALTPLYARSAAAAIIVASTDDIASFTAIEDWIELIDSSCENRPPIVLAVNKTDLTHSVLAQEEIDTQYQPKFSSIFYVSAKTGEFIDGLFLSAGQLGYEFMKASAGRRSNTDLNSRSGAGDCC